VNQLVFSSERRLGNDGGLPRRDWFRHQIYAPGFYTGYGVKTLPQIREGLEEGQWDEARQGVTKVAAAINTLAAQVDRATAGLSRVSK
jgi:N-acetylated-alpha-linked acidic dipeptidase